MDFRLNSFLPRINTSYNVFSLKKIKKNTFMCGLALAASTMLLSACNNSSTNNQEDKKDTVEISSTTENSHKDSSYKVYHYVNAGNLINFNDYAWCETIYPDGSIVRDSAGLKIYISPEKERTVESKTTDRYNNEIITKEFSDGRKIIRKNFFLKNPEEIQYTEKTYNKYDILIENKSYNRMCLNAAKGKFITEELYEKFNDKGILLKWETNKKIAPSDTASVYDKLGRIVYDKDKNEYYKYNKRDTIPTMSFQIYKGCKHIKEYNNYNVVCKTYFQASDGTITAE